MNLSFRPSLRRDLHKFLALALVSVFIYGATERMISKQVRNPAKRMKVSRIESAFASKVNSLPYGQLSLHGAILLVAACVALRTLTTQIKMDPATIRIDEGVFVQKMESIAFTAVQDHEITRNLWERVLGISTLHVLSNDKTNPKLILRGMPSELANDIYDYMRLNAANSVVELIKINEAKLAKKDRS